MVLFQPNYFLTCWLSTSPPTDPKFNAVCPRPPLILPYLPINPPHPTTPPSHSHFALHHPPLQDLLFPPTPGLPRHARSRTLLFNSANINNPSTFDNMASEQPDPDRLPSELDEDRQPHVHSRRKDFFRLDTAPANLPDNCGPLREPEEACI
jgi:hypothetical protein